MATYGVLCPVLDSSVHERNAVAGENAIGGVKDEKRTETSLLSGKAPRFELLQLQDTNERGPQQYMCV